jgi:hypothetical protein
MNNSFGYEFGQKKLTVYKAPHCSRVIEGRKLNLSEEIVEQKFSSFHHFDSKEWKRTSQKTKTF